MAKAQNALHYAISQIGVHESPWHSNRGPIQVHSPRGGVDFYQDHDFLAGRGYPWCATFVLTAYAVTGHPLPYKTAGAYDFLGHYRRLGWSVPLSQAIPGDAVIFNVGSGHIALFERLNGSIVHTVDGNHNDRVARAVRNRSLVAGVIHVPDVHNIPPVKIPWTITVTSESGHKMRVVTTRCAQSSLFKYVLPPLIKRYGKASITFKKGIKK